MKSVADSLSKHVHINKDAIKSILKVVNVRNIKILWSLTSQMQDTVSTDHGQV